MHIFLIVYSALIFSLLMIFFLKGVLCFKIADLIFCFINYGAQIYKSAKVPNVEYYMCMDYVVGW